MVNILVLQHKPRELIGHTEPPTHKERKELFAHTSEMTRFAYEGVETSGI